MVLPPRINFTPRKKIDLPWNMEKVPYKIAKFQRKYPNGMSTQQTFKLPLMGAIALSFF